MDGMQPLRDILNNLIKKDKLSIETFSIATGVEEKTLSNFLNGSPLKFPVGKRNKTMERINLVVGMLTEGIELVQDDDRIKAIIEELNNTYKIDNKALSQYVGISEEQLQNFINEPTNASYEIRYHIAAKVYALLCTFKF